MPRAGDGLSELDGQLLLDLGPRGDDDLEELFAAAEAAEAAGRPRRGGARSTAAASTPTPATRSPPSTAPTACARSGGTRRGGAGLRRARSSSTRASSRPGSTSRGLLRERGHVASARRHLAPRGRARSRLRRRGLQSRRRSSSTPATSTRRGAGGSATSSSTATPTGRARAPAASRYVELQARSEDRRLMHDRLPLRRPRGRAACASCSPTAPARRWTRPSMTAAAEALAAAGLPGGPLRVRLHGGAPRAAARGRRRAPRR